MSPASESVAVIVTTSVPSPLFSTTLAVVSWLVNTGALLVAGGSSSSFTVTLAEDAAPTA